MHFTLDEKDVFVYVVKTNCCYVVFRKGERQNLCICFSSSQKFLQASILRKVRGNSDYKISGLGFLNDEGTLLCRCVSKTGKPYTRAFDEVEQHCHPILGKENEFKGYITMYYEYEGDDIEVEYSVWYKAV